MSDNRYKYVRESNGRFIATCRICGLTLIRLLYEPKEGMEGMRQRIYKSIRIRLPNVRMEDIEFYGNDFYFGGCVPAVDGKSLIEQILNDNHD